MLGALSVRLSSPGAREGPGVSALADALGPPVLPGEAPLVPAQSAARPEVRRPVSGHLLHEVIPLGRGVQRHHPHPTARAVAAGCAPAEGVASLSPGEEVVPPLPHVVTTTTTSSSAGLGLLREGGGGDLHYSSAASSAGGGGGGGRERGEGSVGPGGCRVEGRSRRGGSGSEGVEPIGRVENVLEESLALGRGHQRQRHEGDRQDPHLEREAESGECDVRADSPSVVVMPL